MIISYFKFVFLWFTSSFYISSLVFNNSLSNLATVLIIMHSFQPCVDRFSLTGPSQKLKTLRKGQLSHDLLLSFLINSFKALFFKKLCQFKLIFINDILFQSASLHFIRFIIVWESWWRRIIAWQPWGQCGTIRKQDQLEKAALKTR